MSALTYLRQLVRWFHGHRTVVIVIGACLLIEMAFNAFVPVAFQRLIDDAITPRNDTALVHILVALGVAAIVTTAAGTFGDYMYARLSVGVLGRIRQRLFDHLQTQSPAFYQKYSAGEISARYSTDLAGVEQTLGSWIPWAWKPALDVVAYNAVMFTVDWQLALLSQLLWPMVLLGPRIFAPKASSAASERKAKEAVILTTIDEATAGRNVVRAFGLEARMSERFSRQVAALARTSRRGAFFGSALERSAGVGILILQLVVLGVGASRAFTGSISVGGLAAFYTVFNSLSNALLYLAQYSTILISSAAGLARIEQMLREQSSVPDAPDAVDLAPFHGAITLHDCVYIPEPGRRILDGVSLTIRHGEWVAFVGPSGSGKSTVLNAIMRAFDPTHGSISIDGHDLRTVTRTSFIRQSAVVFQDSFFYNSTIRENLRLGRIDATDADIEAACRDAEIHESIMAMPRGYDSPVGERSSLLSGGQRQRLSIARALVRDPRILILDEATSALDPGTESAINATLERLARGRTVLAVTHRLASTVNCHRIFVMKHGQLAESGTHRELMAEGGLYAKLWRTQEGIHISDDGSSAGITVERLKLIPLLATLDESMLLELSRSQFMSETLPTGRNVVVEGDRGDTFYILARGRVEVVRRDATGQQQVVAELEDGDHFGEFALMHDAPRSATVRTVLPSTFLTLHRKQFQQLLDRSPAVRAAILAQDVERTSAANETQLGTR